LVEGDITGESDDTGELTGELTGAVPLPSSNPALPTSCAASTVWITLVMLFVVDSAALSPPFEIVMSFACANASAIAGPSCGRSSIYLYRK
jgi:hypothetical protein